ncbi:MAG: acyl carrier protein [Eubacterium sp.]|jgi:acyl carrier protein|nr:acyl carrier protein [Eubacterium sp.]
MEEKVIEMLEEILELDEGELTMDTDLSEVEEWDSISKLALMAEIKKNWKKNLTVDEIKKFQQVKDICEFLK